MRHFQHEIARMIVVTLLLNWLILHRLDTLLPNSSSSWSVIFLVLVVIFFPVYRLRGVLKQKLEFADKNQFIDEFFELMEDLGFHPSAQIEHRYFFTTPWTGARESVRLTFLSDKECEIRYPGRLARAIKKRMGVYVTLKTLSAAIPK